MNSLHEMLGMNKIKKPKRFCIKTNKLALQCIIRDEEIVEKLLDYAEDGVIELDGYIIHNILKSKYRLQIRKNK